MHKIPFEPKHAPVPIVHIDRAQTQLLSFSLVSSTPVSHKGPPEARSEQSQGRRLIYVMNKTKLRADGCWFPTLIKLMEPHP